MLPDDGGFDTTKQGTGVGEGTTPAQSSKRGRQSSNSSPNDSLASAVMALASSPGFTPLQAEKSPTEVHALAMAALASQRSAELDEERMKLTRVETIASQRSADLDEERTKKTRIERENMSMQQSVVKVQTLMNLYKQLQDVQASGNAALAHIIQAEIDKLSTA